MDEPGALQWREPDTLWMIGTSVNPFGGMSFVSGRVLHSYDLRTRQHKTLAASPTTERRPILTGSGASFMVPVEGTVGSPDPEQIGRASCREAVCEYVQIWVVAVAVKKKTKIQ